MREQRYRNSRIRSPPRNWIREKRDRERMKGNGQSSSSRSSGPVRSELEQTRDTGPAERRENDSSYFYSGGQGNEQVRNLSQFSGSRIHGESPSLKFHWNNLLAGNSKNVNLGTWYGSGIGGQSHRTNVEMGYQGNGLSDFGAVPITSSIESGRVRGFSTYSNDLGTMTNYKHIGGRVMPPMGNHEVGVHSNNETLRQWEHRHLPKTSASALYKQERELMFDSSVASFGDRVPISQPSAFPGGSPSILNDESLRVHKQDPPHSFNGLNRSQEISHGHVGQSEHGQAPCFNATETSGRPKGLADYRRVHLGPTEVMDEGFKYPEMQASERNVMATLPDNIPYDNITRFQKEYRRQDSSRPSIVDSIVDKIDGIESSHGNAIRGFALMEHNLSVSQQLIPSYLDATRVTYKTDNYGEGLGARNTQLEYGTEDNYREALGARDTQLEYRREVCRGSGSGSLPLGADDAYERDASFMSYGDGGSLRKLPVLDYDQHLYEQEVSSNQRLTVEELAMLMHGQSEERRSLYLESRSPRNQNASDSVHYLNHEEGNWFDEDMNHVHCNNQLSSPSLLVPGHSNEHKKSVGKSIKKRLGPARIIPAAKPLGAARTDIHKRLGPVRKDINKRLGPIRREIHMRLESARTVPPVNHFVWKRHQECNSPRRNQVDWCESQHALGSNIAEINVKLAKIEPYEDSHEFKQLVDKAFFKFVKLLNENPRQQRKYTNQERTGTLKCSVCGSKSKEFVDTLSLVKHAYASHRTESRTEHLGLHKALCMILGWDASTDGPWVLKKLPTTEAWALKEDLIIWPPVVVVHNISISSNNPDDRSIVSIEGLVAILEGMGFGGGKTKVYRGKPANQSVLTVTFTATFSGLQEAERLHKIYADNKHGRAEFQQVDSSGPESSSVNIQYMRAGKVEGVLYGYLGNAGDLDKLDFESKKRSVIKSKKDIHAIANNSFTAE
ncbi:putative Suppressor of gene silencing protein [Quillaja saponaria]|uniref:Suppressor of gene silencing protein n=1 Tax=Quillaja saponaria TaxID=32244 RepID=A0AAD7VMM1_QUISA|nr:putative Suppressor of gene silencing protein [Quillaja saponaria]